MAKRCRIRKNCLKKVILKDIILYLELVVANKVCASKVCAKLILLLGSVVNKIFLEGKAKQFTMKTK